MRKLLFNKKKDVGAIGIGAMIVLIAMILVAGVAASVIISTSNTLQSQAMKTGTQTTKEVSSGIGVFSIIGKVNVTGNATAGYTYHNMTCLAITVEGRPGSDRIDLNNTFILISDGSTKALLTYAYNNSQFFNKAVTGDLFAGVAWRNLSKNTFAIGVLQDYDGSMSTRYHPAMNRGDKAVLYIYLDKTLGSQLKTRKDVFGQIIPEIGAPGVIGFTSPKAYTNTIYVLQ
jgi:flagellin FlaB